MGTKARVNANLSLQQQIVAGTAGGIMVRGNDQWWGQEGIEGCGGRSAVGKGGVGKALGRSGKEIGRKGRLAMLGRGVGWVGRWKAGQGRQVWAPRHRQAGVYKAGIQGTHITGKLGCTSIRQV